MADQSASVCGELYLIARSRKRMQEDKKRRVPYRNPSFQSVKKVFLPDLWRGSKLPRHYHPHQISLNSLEFGREICKEAIFSPVHRFPSKKYAPRGVHAAAAD